MTRQAGKQQKSLITAIGWAWYMLRQKEAAATRKIGLAMVEACLNNNIGYDQSERYGVINCLKKCGRIAKINEPTEADCSSLVRAGWNNC